MAEYKEKLEHYLILLQKWQKSINLVSTKTLDIARERHFNDSAQLSDFISPHLHLVDIGSGAGFPGLVLAMMRPDLQVTLIESDTKKCTFLSTVSRETKTPITILHKRIEQAIDCIVPDIITARALAPLEQLLDYCLPWICQNSELTLLFLKGQSAQEECRQAQNKYYFDCELFPSRTDNGFILKIQNVALK